jgi:hypothetical protein
MKRLLMVFTLIVFLLFPLVISKAAAQTRLPGVAVGDVFVYDCNVLWTSTDPNATVPTMWLEQNKTRGIRDVITNVTGSVVTWEQTTYYSNGTESSESLGMDVQYGGEVSIFFIAANLNANDTIGIGFYGSKYWINETILKTYPEGPRETNYLDLNREDIHYDYYYDKETGLLVDYCVQVKQDNSTAFVSLRLESSSVWVVTAFPQVNFDITVGSQTFSVNALSNSTVSALNFSQTSKELSFSVNGTSGTTGFCNITLPADLMSGTFSVFKEDALLEENVDYTLAYNGTHYTLQIRYAHSFHTIRIVSSEVIPDLPTNLLMILVIMVLSTAILFLRKKMLKK